MAWTTPEEPVPQTPIPITDLVGNKLVKSYTPEFAYNRVIAGRKNTWDEWEIGSASLGETPLLELWLDAPGKDVPETWIGFGAGIQITQSVNLSSASNIRWRVMLKGVIGSSFSFSCGIGGTDTTLLTLTEITDTWTEYITDYLAFPSGTTEYTLKLTVSNSGTNLFIDNIMIDIEGSTPALYSPVGGFESGVFGTGSDGYWLKVFGEDYPGAIYPYQIAMSSDAYAGSYCCRIREYRTEDIDQYCAAYLANMRAGQQRYDLAIKGIVPRLYQLVDLTTLQRTLDIDDDQHIFRIADAQYSIVQTGGKTDLALISSEYVVLDSSSRKSMGNATIAGILLEE